MKPIEKLIVFGTKKAIVADEKSGQKEGVSYDLTGSTRDAENQHDIGLKDNDKLLEFVLEDGTTWMCDASTLHEVYPELDPAFKPDGKRDADTEAFVLPTTVDAPATERGVVGKIVVKILRVFVKKAFEKAIDLGITKIAIKLEDKHLQHGITEKSELWGEMIDKKGVIKIDAALFSIDKDFKFHSFNENTASNKPYFLFIHGTNSDTLGAFCDLKPAPVWDTLHEIYAKNVLAFQHRTLTQSPLENAVQLAGLLPDGSELHVLTHSRGGIIGDILNKYSDNGTGFTDNHIALLEKEGKRTDDIRAIRALNSIFKKKKLKITKFIRVACPAAGTKLASKRLDHILNVFVNLLGGVFGDILKELLSAAIDSKDNVDVLPGLEAMNPESPFIKILNDPSDDNEITGKPLAVISGNGRVNFSGKGLLVILGKLFYWQRNDLVVNTDSMYLGAKRSEKIQYFFDHDVGVNHVKYFENNKTREAIDLALKTEVGNTIPGFKEVEQYEVPAGDRALIEHGALKPGEHPISGNRPIVILLPGIMGSNLTQNNKEIWLHYRRILKGGLTNLKYPNVSDIVADSVVKTSYYKLYKWLLGRYDVLVYPFDWRLPLEESAKELNTKIESLLKLDQPIKIIGHSMGGVLVRDFIINHKDTWQRLNASKNFRLVFLGCPLSGSHRILTVLFGQDSIIKTLSKLDLFNTKKGLLKIFSKFPGILDLLPIVNPKDDPKNDFGRLKVWQSMRTAFGEPDWPLPTEEDLDRFKAYRAKILEERDHIDYSNMVYIAGKDKMTPYGYHLDTIPPKKELYFLYTSEGDQSVTWELGIPKGMDPSSVYYTRISHGALANDSSIFGGIEEILSKGRTNLLRNSKPSLRTEEKIFRTEPDIDFDLSEEGLIKTVLGLGRETEAISSQIPISVSISNGDLRYAAYPVLAGHFLNDGVLYAEKAIDDYLNGSLRSKHLLGLYPGEIGSNALFDNVGDNDFAGAIIVGLGEPDQLTSFQLAKSVELGVLNYLLSLRGKKIPKKGIGVSSLVMASDYGGLSIESSMEGVISGVDNANAKIKMLSTEDYSTVQHIEFVELYANRALNCMYVLNQLANRENAALNIILGSKKIKKLLGIRKRIPLDMSEDWWNRITVRQRKVNKDTEELEGMVFGASTSDSREEESEIYSSTPLINQFISEISTDNQWSSCTAKTLFELLIPNALKEKLKRKGNISWILDTKTASYPWELLQDSTSNAKPLCVSSGMIRQLATGQYRHTIKRVADNKALIIADPNLDGYIGQLPGARDEGELVKGLLDGAGYPVNPRIGTNASTIVRELFCNDYAVIHLAGHGVFKPKSPKESGMVIGKKLFLTVFEIQQMPVVPELVFVNCCHLGYTTDIEEQFYQNRYKLAANIGTQLIQIGVKAVIAAGWAVNDSAALEFAKVFYERMLDGYAFGESVKMARGLVYEKYPQTNTWGAYQCYGDPFFRLKNMARGPWMPRYIVPEEAEIHLENLLNQLQMGMTTSKDALDELGTIKKAIAEHDDFLTASILEREAKIYQELAMYKEAVERFEELLCIEKAHFSFSCMETHCNTRIKWYVKEVFENANSAITQKEAREHIKDVIAELQILLSAGKTAERLNLLGSAYKRLSMVSETPKTRLEAYKASMDHYKEAYEHPVNGNKIYSLTNAAELAFLMHCSRGENTPALIKIKEEDHEQTYDLQGMEANSAKKGVKSVKELLEKHSGDLKKGEAADIIDYWDLVTSLNIDLCLLLIEEDEIADKKWNAIVDQFNEIWKKAGSEAKKVAELEHLQFLIHSLNRVAGNSNSFSPIGTSASKDKLEVHTEELRNALHAVRKQIKNKKTITPKKKGPSSK